MRHLLLSLLAIFSAIAPLCAQDSVVAEKDIMFGLRLPESTTLSAGAAERLSAKVTQILGRCNAGASGESGAFVIEPTLTVGDAKNSEGLVRNVTSVNGELVLAAKHRYGGALFYSGSFPLEAVAKGNVSDPALLLAKSIKPSDAAFVRFIRNARRSVVEYAATHPEVFDVPEPPKPANDTVLIVAFVHDTPQDTDPVSTDPVSADTVPSDPAPGGDAGNSTDNPAEAPSKPSTADSGCEIFISDPGWETKVKNCSYDATTRSIHLVMSIKCKVRLNDISLYTTMKRALNTEGMNYKDLYVDGFYHDYPSDIPVTVNFYIKNVHPNPGTVPFVEFSVGGTTFELRNITVE